MKKLILLLSLLLLAVCAFAQPDLQSVQFVAANPNGQACSAPNQPWQYYVTSSGSGLAYYCNGSPGTWALLNAGGLSLNTFASSPTPTLNVVYLFTDASAPGVCTGGGSSNSICKGTGSGWAATSASSSGGTGNAAAKHAVAFSATPTYTCTSASAGTVDAFQVATLSGNITSATLSTCTTGQLLEFSYTQAASGGPYTVAMPTGFDACPINQNASTVSNCSYFYDGTLAHLVGFSPTAAAVGLVPCTAVVENSGTGAATWPSAATGSSTGGACNGYVLTLNANLTSSNSIAGAVNGPTYWFTLVNASPGYTYQNNTPANIQNFPLAGVNSGCQTQFPATYNGTNFVPAPATTSCDPWIQNTSVYARNATASGFATCGYDINFHRWACKDSANVVSLVQNTFYGSGVPGSVTENLSGDTYINTATSPPTSYQCFAASGTAFPACTAVASGNWQLSGGANSAGTYVVTAAANAPTNAVNLGALNTGLVKISVSGSTATPGNAAATDVSSVFFGTGGGTAQAQTVALSPAVVSLANPFQVCWIPTAANTGGGATLTVNSTAAHTIVKAGGAVAANDILTTAQACAVYDPTGTQYELQNPQTTASGGSNAQLNAANTYTGGGLQDFSVMKIKPPVKTVSTLPAASGAANQVYEVTDGTTVTDCTTGGGSSITWCVSNGTSWSSMAGASSGSGCTSSGGTGVVQASNNAGGCQSTSVTDTGATTGVQTTEFQVSPSFGLLCNAGTGGWAAHTLVTTDTSASGSTDCQAIQVTTSGNTWLGAGVTAVSAAGSGPVQRLGLVQLELDSGTSVIGDLIVPSTTTAGYVHDSGISSSNNQLNTNSIGTVRSVATGPALIWVDLTPGDRGKVVVPRLDSVCGGSCPDTNTTLAPNAGLYDIIEESTSTSTGYAWLAPTGTFFDGQKLWIKMQCTNAAAQALTWPSSIIGGTDVALPASCSGNSLVDDFLIAWDTLLSKWHMVAVARGY